MRHFKESDFACPCCGENLMDKATMNYVDDVREDLGSAMIVESGYRCPKHNAAVGGAKGSMHPKGIAVDIKITAMTPEIREKLLDLLRTKYKDIFKGRGVGKFNLHVDTRLYYATWRYDDRGRVIKAKA